MGIGAEPTAIGDAREEDAGRGPSHEEATGGTPEAAPTGPAGSGDHPDAAPFETGRGPALHRSTRHARSRGGCLGQPIVQDPGSPRTTFQ
jgi:hypothetical protein